MFFAHHRKVARDDNAFCLYEDPVAHRFARPSVDGARMSTLRLMAAGSGREVPRIAVLGGSDPDVHRDGM